MFCHLILLIGSEFRQTWDGCGRAMELGNFQFLDVLLIWMIVDKGLLCLQQMPVGWFGYFSLSLSLSLSLADGHI